MKFLKLRMIWLILKGRSVMYKMKVNYGIVNPCSIQSITSKAAIVKCVIHFVDYDLLIGDINVG